VSCLLDLLVRIRKSAHTRRETQISAKPLHYSHGEIDLKSGTGLEYPTRKKSVPPLYAPPARSSASFPTVFFSKHLQLNRQGALSSLRLGSEARSHGLLDAFFEPSNRSPRNFSCHQSTKLQASSPDRNGGNRGFVEGCGILSCTLHKAWDSSRFAFWACASLELTCSALVQSLCISVLRFRAWPVSTDIC